MEFLVAVGLPLLVFAAEMCVVAVGTLRIIFVARGMKRLAPLLAFFEVTIWLFAITQVMQNLSNAACFLAFAGGFTFGNYLGMLINEKLAMGNSVVRIVNHRDAGPLVNSLAQAEYGVTRLEGQGATGPVQIVLTVVKRREITKVTRLIQDFDPNAFYAIDDVEAVNAGIFPLQERISFNPLRILLGKPRPSQEVEAPAKAA